jgi:hypothetical protein
MAESSAKTKAVASVARMAASRAGMKAERTAKRQGGLTAAREAVTSEVKLNIQKQNSITYI